ncbi:MAG: MFS transporter, partial [Candidatus Aenigmarchaeota archaeon]|nr:MFS transporter [Candidatus Aenigmarchaeota archaeon]
VTYLSLVHGFYIAAISLFIGFLVFTVFYKERRLERITSYRLSTRNIPRATVLVSLIGLSNSLAFSVAYVPGVFLLARSLGLTGGDLFLMFLMSYIVSSMFAWRTGGWIKRHGKEAVLGAGALGYGLFTMSYSLALEPALFFVSLMGVSVSFYVYRIGYKTALLDSTDKKHRGEQVGFSKMLVSLGGIAGPLMGGLLIDGISLQAAFLVAGMFGILGLGLSIWLKRT